MHTLDPGTLYVLVSMIFASGNPVLSAMPSAVIFLTAILVLLALLVAAVYYISRLRRKLRSLEQEIGQHAASQQEQLTRLSKQVRTPLTAVVGFSEQLRHTQLLNEQQELLKVVDDAAVELMKIFDHVYATGEAPPVQPPVPQTMIITQREIDKMNSDFMKGKYVLVADDQEMNLLLMDKILTRWQCRFDKAMDGAAAYELFMANQYDMILLDLQMPRMTGIDVTKRIRADKDPLKARVPVLALTSDITMPETEEFRLAGFDDYLLKPFREKDIYHTIVRHLTTENTPMKRSV